ncbi:hypothetical protein AOXY_G35127 [Acipenser oxyrinchus oxyrinchus]|uniref:Defensin, beta-like 3 n=1 Tax=Acipenser oxyrinchus oxyrinchus TaxID=40147 RepID=A0AAD8CFT2_ACIOX|nr:hypothetical protein AOXY_G36902 [Acipenser oxyrinchus oxyrinchus]KAK1148397.1 hypothetical protein AOXY_G35127 [Acipenser oxyrinchus oxyrinchus]
MKTLVLALLVLLLLAAVDSQEADVTFWTCGQGGHCRRFCYAHEYVVGYHGCPRRFRYHRFWQTDVMSSDPMYGMQSLQQLVVS